MGGKRKILYLTGLGVGFAGQAALVSAGTAGPCFTCDLAPVTASALPPIGFGVGSAAGIYATNRAAAYVGRDPFADAGLGTMHGDGALKARALANAGDEGLSFQALRRSANRRTPYDVFAAPRDRRSGLGMGARYRAALGGADALSLTLNAAMEMRRYAFDHTGNRWSRSHGYGIGMGWVHATNWQLSLGYLHDDGAARATTIQRSVELAEGAPAGASGYRLEVAFSPAGFDRESPWSIVLAARSLALSRADAAALAATANRDSRLAATLRSRF